MLTKVFVVLFGMASALVLGQTIDEITLCDFVSSTDISSKVSGWGCNNGRAVNDYCGGTWEGITCFQDRVTKIVLKRKDIKGSLPESIGNLLMLGTLNMQENQLEGTMPASIGCLTNIEVLNLNTNRLTGKITDNWDDLTRLEVVNLYNNRLSGGTPTAFLYLKSLREMYINDNQFTGGFPNMGYLSNLQLLSIANNSMLGGQFPAEYCKYAINLVRIHAGGTRLECIAECLYDRQIVQTDAQVIITCEDYKQTATPISYLPQYSASQLDEMSALCALITSTNIGQLPAFTDNLVGQGWTCTKTIYDATRTKKVLPSQNPCYNWRFVGCSSNQVINPAVQSPQHITSLKLGSMGITGALPDQIGNFEFLESIILEDNSLTGTIPHQMGKLKNLLHFNVGSNSLTGEIPDAIGGLNKLQSFSVGKNKLVGTVPFTIGKLKRLHFLELSDNQLSGELPFEMVAMRHLQYAHLKNNKFIGKVPFSLIVVPGNGLRYARNTNLLHVDLHGNNFDCMYENLVDSPELTAMGQIKLSTTISGSNTGNNGDSNSFFGGQHSYGVYGAGLPKTRDTLVTVEEGLPFCEIASPYPSAEPTKRPSMEPTSTPTLAVDLAAKIVVTPTIAACFHDCIVSPAIKVGTSITSAGYDPTSDVSFGALMDEIPTVTNYDTELCNMYADLNCTSATVGNTSCLPACLDNGGCVVSFCSVFSKLDQVCTGTGAILTTAQVALQQECVRNYITQTTDVTIVQFDMYINIEGWATVDEFLADSLGVTALEDSFLALVQNVVAVTTSAGSGNTTARRRVSEGSGRELPTSGGVSAKLTVQVVPPLGSNDTDITVLTVLQQMNSASASNAFGISFAEIYYNTTADEIADELNLLAKRVPVQEVAFTTESIQIVSSARPTFQPTAQPTTNTIIDVLSGGTINTATAQSAVVADLPLLFGIIALASLTFFGIGVYRNYSTYKRHQEPVDMTMLDKLFPPTEAESAKKE